MFKKNIANILTVSRILLIPLFIYSFYLEGIISNLLSFTIFISASITDFFDGYFARYFNSKSNFGACLDPIADKLLVIIAIVMLIDFSHNNLIITISGFIIISREIIVSGMREFLAFNNVDMPVINLSKYKTAFQMIAISLLLLGENASYQVISEVIGQEYKNIIYILSLCIGQLGEILFIISAILTAVTGVIYFKKLIKNL